MIRTKTHIRPMRRQEFQGMKRVGRLHFQSGVDSESNGIHDAGGQAVSDVESGGGQATSDEDPGGQTPADQLM